MKPFRYALIQAGLWTVTLVFSLTLYYRSEQEQVVDLAGKEATTILNKDISLRNWAAKHGGVYVPPTADTPPNPYLGDMPGRDVVTADGKALTLLNPAYLLRKVEEEFSAQYSVKSHLTSLNPINPDNRPDDWEASALHRFDRGEPQVSAIVNEGPESFLRMMVPLLTKKECLKCHGEQGYTEGDVRGGISVKVSLRPYRQITAQGIKEVAAMHGVIWALGILGIVASVRNQLRWIKDREKSSRMLTATLSELEAKVDMRTAQLAQTNEVLRQDIEERTRVEESLVAANADLERANQEIKQTQSQLLQREKMASIGQLAAGVAHEINNPVGFIHSNLSTLAKYLERLAGYIKAQEEAAADLPEEARNDLAAKAKSLKIDRILTDAKDLVGECLEGTDRVKEITINLKNFSRVDHPEAQLASVNTCLEETLRIVWNELKYKATVTKDYGELPEIMCYPQQLNQVFVNILVNAAQALVEKGAISIRTWSDNEAIFVAISDTGPGIPESIRHRLFEPFFTTKEVGKGTGLGLSISYDIIKKHGGEITVESEEGRGTTFTVKLPVSADFTKEAA